MTPDEFIDNFFLRSIRNFLFPIRVEAGWLLEGLAAYEIVTDSHRTSFGAA